MPGYGEAHPTLEIFSYDTSKKAIPPEINRPGIAHIAFEVDDVEAFFVYAQDPEGNIIELQSWREAKY